MTAAETNGAFSLVEIMGQPGTEPPLHTHRNEDEMFYVIAGRLKVTRGAEELVLEAGDSAFLPRGIAHTFEITSAKAQWLVYLTPGGFEDFFATLGTPALKLAPPERPEYPDVQRMIRVGEQFGLTFGK
jgi:quercetin dioxygenase-like cupin family protein